MADAGPQVKAEPPAPRVGGDALHLHLADHDVPCPRCRYNLRGVRTAACPECGLGLELQVRDPRPRWAGAGFLFLLLLWLMTAAAINSIRNVRSIIATMQYAETQRTAAQQAVYSYKSRIFELEQRILVIEERVAGATPDDVDSLMLRHLRAELSVAKAREASSVQLQQRMQLLQGAITALNPSDAATAWGVVRSWPLSRQIDAAWAFGLAIGSAFALGWFLLLWLWVRRGIGGVCWLYGLTVVLFCLYAGMHVWKFVGELRY